MSKKDRYEIVDEVSLGIAMDLIREKLKTSKMGLIIDVRNNTITLQQQKSLHLILDRIAERLNDAGFDQVVYLETLRSIRAGIEIPWEKQTVKDVIWRRIQKAMTGKESSADISTVDPSDIYEVMTKHLSEVTGITCPPWPDQRSGVSVDDK